MKPYNYFPIDRQKLAEQMAAFAAQKPGFDKANYDSESSYKSDYRVYKEAADQNRASLKKPKDFVFYYLSKLDDHNIHDAFKTAFSGRVSIQEDMSLDYCAGQYWCTEYENALAAVIDRISEMSEATPWRERTYEMTVNGESKSCSKEDLCTAYMASLSEEERVSMVKDFWGETISDGYTAGGARKIVKMEEYSGLNTLLSNIDDFLSERVGYAIEGLELKGWHLNDIKVGDIVSEVKAVAAQAQGVASLQEAVETVNKMNGLGAAPAVH